jgi:hypothetical protein
MNRFKDQGDPAYQANPEAVPTKELLKAARKRDYEKAKAARKNEKAAEKVKKAQAREDARAERDKSLWAAMKRAKDLGGDEP